MYVLLAVPLVEAGMQCILRLGRNGRTWPPPVPDPPGSGGWSRMTTPAVRSCACVYLNYTYYINILEDAYGC